MKAVFQPTNYTFEFDDKYFVQVQYTDRTESTIAAFSDLSDAIALANAQAALPTVKAAYVYSRSQQHHSAYNRELVAA